MTNNNPLVSIIIPAYNSEKYIVDAIESSINQTYNNIEIIIINDGSIDNTEKIIIELIEKHQNIKYFYQLNQGACVARNRGISECNGEYVKFLDSDDVLLPNAIRKQVDIIKTLNENTIIYGNFEVTDEFLKTIEKRDLSSKYNENDRSLFSYFDWNIGTSTPLLRRTIVEDINGFDISLPFAQESDFIFRLALKKNKFIHLNETIYLNRQHDSPNRIRNSANYTEYWVFLKLMKKYKKLLIETDQYSLKERQNFIDYFIFKIKAYYQLRNFKDARQAMIELSKFQIKYFRDISYTQSFDIILLRFKLSFIAVKFRYLTHYIKRLLKKIKKL